MKLGTRLFIIGTLVGVFAPQLSYAQKSGSETRIGQEVDGFTLKDYRGKSVSLADFGDQKAVVLVFLGTECPLAKLYGPRLAQLAKEYESRGVAFIGVNSNTQDSITEIAAHARIHKIKFPILKDLGNKVADQLGAERTPEVFVLDDKRVVRYWGRIDDQYGVGYIRDEPKRKDLQIALDELLAGKPVSKPEIQSVGCHIGRVQTPNKDSDVTYSNQISRLLQKRCVECHREGEIAPFSLTDFDEVVGWAEMIEEVVKDQRMPPWHADPKHGNFKNDRHLLDDEKQLIYDWVANGAPEGDPSKLPPPKEYVSGWQLPKYPDRILNINEKPFKVRAEGEVRYQRFRVDPGFKEDMWIKAAQILPGNRAVVHHILAFAVPKIGNGRPGEGAARGYLVGYVPGLRAEPYPDGMAKRIPANSQLVFQVHYTPIGTEQFDQSKIGFVFADEKDVKYEVTTTSAVQARLRIPPRNDNYRVEATNWKALPESKLLSFMPHMHLRGKSFSYEARYPDGSKEMLLDVPAYDFNWQTAYRLAEPKELPAGTRIHCVAHFDNSKDNLNNPNPNKEVRWGDQTWEEMMIGYFDIAAPRRESDKKPAASPFRERLGASLKAVGVIRKFDKNGDNQLTRDEVPRQHQATFNAWDVDKDDIVTLKEAAKALQR
jgi:peroxiredoxin